MVRSLKKGPFVRNQLLIELEYKIKSEKRILITLSRSSTILPLIIGYTITVYNGHEHFPIFIRDQIIRHKLGEFAFTRVFCGHAKSDKKMKRLFYFYETKKAPNWFPLGH